MIRVPRLVALDYCLHQEPDPMVRANLPTPGKVEPRERDAATESGN